MIVLIVDHSHLHFEQLVGVHVSINYFMLSSVYLESFYSCIRLYMSNYMKAQKILGKLGIWDK